MKTEIRTADSLWDAVDILSEGCEPVGVTAFLNLSREVTPKQLRDIAESMEGACCGEAEGLFWINGELHFVFCDFGH